MTFGQDSHPFSSFSQLSVFDLDHTLCRVNTSFRFGFFLLPGQFLTWKIPYLMGCYALHKLGILPIDTLHELAYSYFFYRKSILQVRVDVDAFLNRHLMKMLNEKVISSFKEAKGNGHYTVLLSSSPDFLVGEIARRVGFHEWSGTEYLLLQDNSINGVGVLMEGENKALYVTELMKKMNLEKERVTVYSDSYFDIPLFETAGRRIAVNPDRRLKKHAARHNWVVI